MAQLEHKKCRQSLLSWLSSFAAQLLAAFIGSFLALRKYKKETIWQEKYNAYKEILAAIQNMKHWADETYGSCLCLLSIAALRGDFANKRPGWIER
jgi:hypothetical protein